MLSGIKRHVHRQRLAGVLVLARTEGENVGNAGSPVTRKESEQQAGPTGVECFGVADIEAKGVASGPVAGVKILPAVSGAAGADPRFGEVSPVGHTMPLSALVWRVVAGRGRVPCRGDPADLSLYGASGQGACGDLFPALAPPVQHAARNGVSARKLAGPCKVATLVLSDRKSNSNYGLPSVANPTQIRLYKAVDQTLRQTTVLLKKVDS